MKAKHHSIQSAPITQSGEKSLTTANRSKSFVLALSGFLFISVGALLPSPAHAQCKRWDVSGKWGIEVEGANGTRVAIWVDVQQGEWKGTSANLTGTGKIPTNVSVGGKGFPLVTALTGNITDNSFGLITKFGNQRIYYSGEIRPDGVLSGTYRVEREPFGKGNTPWSATKNMQCVEGGAN